MSLKVVVVALISLLSMKTVRSQSDELMIEGQTGSLHLQHSVVAKENWYSIGRLYNLSPKELALYNKLEMNKPLAIGQELRIPLTAVNFSQNGVKAAGETLVPLYHIVQEKEWLYRISVNHNKVAIANLEKWNNINKDQVRAGMHLIVGYLKVKTALSALATKGRAPLVAGTGGEKNAKAGEEGAGKTEATSAARPEGTGVAKTEGTNVTKPEGAGVAKTEGASAEKPSGTNVTKSEGAGAAKPTGTNVTKSEGTNTAKPTGTNVTKSEGTNTAKPTGMNAAKPEGTGAAKSEGAGVVKTEGGTTSSGAGKTTTGMEDGMVKPVSAAGKSFNGGFFKSDYSEEGKSVAGMAGIFKSTSGWQDGKYYALMNNVPVGTIVKVTGSTSGKTVYAKVLGQLPDMKESAGLAIRISNAAASELGEGDGKFNVDVRY